MKPKSVNLYMVKEDSDSDEFLDESPDSGSISRKATEQDCTLEAMAQMLDLDAENVNAHSFVASHRGLAALLFQETGREAATRILRRLVNYRGLHGLVDECACRSDRRGAPNPEKELGVQLSDWSEWNFNGLPKLK